jgi:hypothetical protein
MHEECRYRLTCGIITLLCYEAGEMGTILPRSMHLTADEIVPDGRHTIVAALIEFA